MDIGPAAIWFRFDPIRASSRVRSRSSSVCATVQVRTRPTDRRTRSDSDNPTERAFGVPLGPLRLGGSDLHPDFAPSLTMLPAWFLDRVFDPVIFPQSSSLLLFVLYYLIFNYLLG